VHVRDLACLGRPSRLRVTKRRRRCVDPNWLFGNDRGASARPTVCSRKLPAPQRHLGDAPGRRRTPARYGGIRSRLVSEPKLHHWIPRSYLRRFAESDRVAVRHRTRGMDSGRSTAKVAAENGLYRVPDQPLTAEGTLEKIESAALRGFEQLQEGKLPRTGTEARQALALFMGIQLNRAPTSQTISRFLSELRSRSGNGPFTDEQVRSLLIEQYGFEPRDAEVYAAKEQANAAPPEERDPSKQRSDELGLMFEIALGMAPFLEGHVWSLEVTKSAALGDVRPAGRALEP